MPLSAVLRIPSPTSWPTVIEADASAFRDAARRLPSGVSIMTLGAGGDRIGLTATSVSFFSAEPPTLLLSVDRLSSTYALLATHGAFAVNVLAADQRELAERFAAPLPEAQRFARGRWVVSPSGVPCLADGLVVFDCELAEAIERGARAIVLGRVRRVMLGDGSGALLAWRGVYDQIGWSSDEISRAVGLTPSVARGRTVRDGCDGARG